jgi:DNA-binding NarL/FixJ family response regulator
MVEGWSYRRIAVKMGITQGTVRWHVSRIADKLPREDGVAAYQTVFLWAIESRRRTKAA